jgi:hypothetical protein
MKHTHLLVAGLVVAGIVVGRVSAQDGGTYERKLVEAIAGVNGKDTEDVPVIVSEAVGDEAKTIAFCKYLAIAGRGDRDFLAQQMQIAQNQKIISLLQSQQKGDKKPIK